MTFFNDSLKIMSTDACVKFIEEKVNKSNVLCNATSYDLPETCYDATIDVCKNVLGARGEWDTEIYNRKCKRIRYLGDPGYCCNKNANSKTPYGNRPCFDTQNRTCSPEYRNITSNRCYAPATEYCTRATSTDVLNENWNGAYPQCMYTTDNWLIGGNTRYGYTVSSGDPIPFPLFSNAQGYRATTDMLVDFNKLYSNWGYKLGAPRGTNEYSGIENNIYAICQSSPGNCQNMLRDYCSQYSARDLSQNPNLVRWCGCHLPDSEYAKYVNQYQLNKECTPLCNRIGNIPITDPTGTTPLRCTTDNCLIDNLSINLLNSSVTNGISFNQLCGGCGQNGSCTCIFENNTVTGVNAVIGGSIDINQTCGSQICYGENPDPTGPAQIQVPCSDIPGTTEISEPIVTSPYNTIFPYAFVGFIVLLFVFLLLALWFEKPLVQPPIPIYSYNPYIV